MLHSARMAAGDDTVMGELPEPDSEAAYAIGEDRVRGLLRCEISTVLTAAMGPNPESRLTGPMPASANYGHRRTLPRVYFPAAFLSASLIRSCQPGPPSWK